MPLNLHLIPYALCLNINEPVLRIAALLELLEKSDCGKPDVL
jgi:hypothetical protein